MTSLALLSEAILSGQVPDHEVPALCKEHPGLDWVLEGRSRATPARAVQMTGQGVAPPTTALCPVVDKFDLVSDPSLGHCLMGQESRRPVKRFGFFSKFVRSLHLSSLPEQQWRKG